MNNDLCVDPVMIRNNVGGSGTRSGELTRIMLNPLSPKAEGFIGNLAS